MLVMFNVKVFATQDGWLDGQIMASQTNMTNYIDPFATHVDQKGIR